MNIIKPKKLNLGDTISIIAPSGRVQEEKIFNAKKYFENKGYNVKLGKNIFKNLRYMAGTDEQRLEDLENAFADEETNAIFCARGGYGAIRIVNKIDYTIIKNNPKIFCGYSDITALSAMIYKKTGLITFSSPMANGDFQPDAINDFTEKKFWDTLTGNENKIVAENLKIYKDGKAEGILFGGNLSTIVSLCGQDFIPDEPFIFFAEDLNEPVYKIDKSISQLLNIEKFRKNVRAFLLGDFLDIENYEQLEDLFLETTKDLQIPVFGGYNISHNKKKCTVPFGCYAYLTDGVVNLDNFLI